MEWKRQQKKQLEWKECGEIIEPSTFQKTQGIFQQDLANLPQESFIPLSNEEIRATRTRKLEAERMQSMVIEYARHTMYR